jgi:hypothetical protein
LNPTSPFARRTLVPALLLDTKKYKVLDRHARLRPACAEATLQMFAYAHAYACRAPAALPAYETPDPPARTLHDPQPPREVAAPRWTCASDLRHARPENKAHYELRDCLILCEKIMTDTPAPPPPSGARPQAKTTPPVFSRTFAG